MQFAAAGGRDGARRCVGAVRGPLVFRGQDGERLQQGEGRRGLSRRDVLRGGRPGGCGRALLARAVLGRRDGGLLSLNANWNGAGGAVNLLLVNTVRSQTDTLEILGRAGADIINDCRNGISALLEGCDGLG